MPGFRETTKAYSCKFKELIIILDIFVTEFMSVRTLISVLFASVIMISEAKPAYAQFQHAPTEASPLYCSDTLTICIMGDMMMHESQIINAAREGKPHVFDTYFQHLKDRISSADIAIGNMEFTLGGEPYTGYPSFSAPDPYGEYLAECGFDIFLCANNHIYDRGKAGAERTLKKYRELQDRYGIRYCGLASDEEDLKRTNPLFITSKGIRTAVINFTYGTNGGTFTYWPKVNYMSGTENIENALAESETADFTLVLPHWGEEYELMHSEQQRKTAEWLVSEGADMIIGAHPHVVQDCEYIDGIQVAYSLGNAVSNMSAENTQIELMATVRIVRERNGDIRVLPIGFTWLWCSRPGGYCDSYTVLPVEEFIGRKHEWKGAWDYEKMMRTYRHVRKTTGINNL